MKKQFMASLLLLGISCTMLHAQVDSEKWFIFESKTGRVKSEEVSHQAVPMMIVGRDDRVEDTGRAPYWERAVVVLEIDGGILCSGSMVGPNVVLTAAHCLYAWGKYAKVVNVYAVGMPSSEDEQPIPPSVTPSSPKETPKKPKEKQPKNPYDPIANIVQNDRKRRQLLDSLLDQIKREQSTKIFVSCTEKYANEGFKKGKHPSASSKQLWVPAEWIELTKEEYDQATSLEKEEPYDYGIVVLEQPLGNETGWLNLLAPSTENLKGAEIMVIGRGGDKPARSLWSAKGQVGEVHRTYFFHNVDMVGGNSGGPIMYANDRNHRIIALANFHVENRKSYPNGGLRITEKIISAVRKATSN